MAGCFINELALGLVFANYNLWLLLFALMTALALWLLPRTVPWLFGRFGGRVIEPEIKLVLLILFLLGGLANLANSEAVLPA